MPWLALVLCKRYRLRRARAIRAVRAPDPTVAMPVAHQLQQRAHRGQLR